MPMNETRRESRIPRPANQEGTPAYARPLSEKNPPNSAGGSADRKRKAASSSAAVATTSLDAIPETSKRTAVASGSSRPTRSASQQQAAPAAPAFPASGSAAQRDGAAAAGPAPGDETFEDISARTGATVQDVLGRKMQFKKGLKAEKKVEEMVPMIKDLRAVGWYLHSGKERTELDSQQWKAHGEQMEQELATERQGWSKKEGELEQQIKDIKALLEQAESNNSRLTTDLSSAEARLGEQATSLQRLQAQLQDTEDKLAKASKELAEKESKIKGMEEVMHHSQSYSSTLQQYNTTLQADLNNEKAKREEVAASRDALQAQVAELTGRAKSMEDRLHFDQDQVGKLRDERDVSVRDVGVLRLDLDNTRQERDRLLAENARVKEEYDRIKQLGGKSIETMETLTNEKATLEVQLTTQQRLIANMREELGMSKEQRAMAESLSESRGSQLEGLKSQLQQLQAALDSAERRVLEGEQIRRKLHNTIQELKGNIRVFCRVRPLTSSEQTASSDPDGALALDFPPTDDPLSAAVTLQAPARDAAAAMTKHSFTFDKVFAPGTSQEGVFEEISELVQSALDGHKVCIFAYGQTGSGKTFTMLGSQEQPGMIPRAMRQIFESSKRLEAQGWKFSMQASMLEIYNEEYKDLLAKRTGRAQQQWQQGKEAGPQADAKKHQVVHNADGSTTVSELTVVDISQPERVEALLAEAMDKRSVGCTALNEQSSRSHMVFTMRLEGVNAAADRRVSGVLNLIDLAGSERVKESGASGVRLKEAQAINASLSALGDVIMALSNKQQHVPYRNSKLTYLLQPCLGGDAKTLMFVNVAPSAQFAGESLCSLRFAAKVNACEINAKKKQAYNATFSHYNVKCGADTVEWSSSFHSMMEKQVGLGFKRKLKWYFGQQGWPSSTALAPGSGPAIPQTEDEQGQLIEALQSYKNAEYTRVMESGQVETRPGVLRLMDEAREAGLKLGVCSAATRKIVAVTLKSLLGQARFGSLDCFLAGDDVEKKKPDPAIYLLAAEKLGLRPEECVAVEDSTIGLQAARGAGMRCIITYTDASKDEPFPGAERIVQDLGSYPAAVTVKELQERRIVQDDRIEMSVGEGTVFWHLPGQ